MPESEPGPDWLDAGKVGRLWGVRTGAVQTAAGWARVRSRRCEPTSGGTYGPPQPYWLYAAEDVRRVAEEIADGRRVITPAWRRDSGQGVSAEAREWGRQALKSVLVLAGFAAVVLLVLLLLLLLFG